MKKFILALFVALSFAMTVPVALPGKQITTVEAAAKVSLKSQNGKYYCYVNGKKIKSQWKTIKGKQYYFKKDGSAATLSTKINGKYYVFNKKGQLQVAKKYDRQIIKIGKVNYRVNKKGIAVKGWATNKNLYFGNNGKAYTGIRVINEKFYAFDKYGYKQKAKTKELQKAAKYEKDFTALKKLIGKPVSASYFAGCYGPGKDGYLEYKNFVVYTYKHTDGKEIFMGAE